MWGKAQPILALCQKGKISSLHCLAKKSYHLGNGHWLHFAKIHVQAITFTCKLNLDDITIVVHDIKVYMSWPWHMVIYWGQGQVHIKPKVVFGTLLLTCELDLDYIIIHTIIVYDPRVFYDFDPMSYLQGQGHNVNVVKIHVRIIIFTCWLD